MQRDKTSIRKGLGWVLKRRWVSQGDPGDPAKCVSGSPKATQGKATPWVGRGSPKAIHPGDPRVPQGNPRGLSRPTLALGHLDLGLGVSQDHQLESRRPLHGD